MFGAKDKDKSGGRRDPLTNPGIVNLGNSCYLASVVQGLGASRPLRDALAEYPGAEVALRSNTSSTSLNKDAQSLASDDDGPVKDGHDPQGGVTREVIPGTPTRETSPSLQLLTENPFPDSLPLSSALASTLVKLWTGKQSTISVKTLMRALNRKNEDWNEFDQMDAHELLRYLLDGVSMEEIDLIKKINPPPPPKPKKKKKERKPRGVAHELRKNSEKASTGTDAEASDSESLDTSEAESLLQEDPTYRLPPHPPADPRYKPFIETIFGGKLASVIVCESCRGVSRIEEDFLDISLPIKQEDPKPRRRDRLRKFLSSSPQSKEVEQRPRMAPRAPTRILSVSETEGSEAEDAQSGYTGGAAADREKSRTSNSSNLLSDDTGGSKVQRRKSLDPGLLRSNTKRNFLSVGLNGSSNGSKSKESGASSSMTASKTVGSESGAGDSLLKRSRTTSRNSGLIAKPTKEQQEYIQKLFAEIPGPSPMAALPLRIAQPGGPALHPTSAEANGSSLAREDAMSTGLYQCLMQFTSVELLEGDNAFQCRRCWKLLHPDLVAEVGRQRAAKALEQARKRGDLPLAAQVADKPHPIPMTGASTNRLLHRPALTDDEGTPRPSFRASTIANGKARDSSVIDTNRRLVAERRSQATDVTMPEVDTSPPTNPEIHLIASSPPLMAPESAQMLAGDDEVDAGLSGFSQMTVTPINEGHSASIQSDLNSDAGHEADEEEFSASEAEGPSTHKKEASVSGSIVSFADQTPPSRTPSVLSSLPRGSRASSPTLPPRAQRYLARRAHKRYLISELPPILVLHLKRFQQTSKSSLFGSFSNLKKLDDKVTFPLYLDMAPFMAPAPLKQSQSKVEKMLKGAESDSERGRHDHKHSKQHWFRRASPSAELRNKSQYRLYGVISHQGNMSSGHYVAYLYTSQRTIEGQHLTRSDHEAPRQWIYCSDDLVRIASVDEVLRTQAYLLLYERVDLSSPSKL